MYYPTLDMSQLNFSTAGIAGLIGGEEAVAAMATVHVYEGRKWLGWYNSPGSYVIAKRYGRLSRSRFFDGLFPGVQTDPATLFELDGLAGPKFTAVHSGSIIDSTAHLGALLLKHSAEQQGKTVVGRTTLPIGVSVIELDHIPSTYMHPAPLNTFCPAIALLPISVSWAASAACANVGDWYSFSSILIGIIAGGLSSLAIGSAEFVFSHPEAATGSPPGDGILGTDREIVLLKGPEGAVNSITRGHFSLRFANGLHHSAVRWCSVLLVIQALAQLFLIPQGTSFGQLMFIVSLAVSWAYNLSLSSIDRERVQRQILLHRVLQSPQVTKYTLGTRTAMSVFALLVLKPSDPEKILQELLPNDTKVWRIFKSTVLQRLRRKEVFSFTTNESELAPLAPSERELLKLLFGDAQSAYDGYVDHCAK